MNIVSVLIENNPADRPKGKGQDRQIFRLLQHPALGIVQAGDKIFCFT